MQTDTPPQGASLAQSSIRNAPTNPLILKLESLARLSDADRAVLETISANPRTVAAHTDLVREGDAPSGVYLILKGLACRYKMRANGARQIMAYRVPGDFCDLDVAMLTKMDHAIGTLSACQVVKIPLETIQKLLQDYPTIHQAMRLATLVDEATLREWLVNLGCRTAEERIAHLLIELLMRLEAVGCASSDGYELPITQPDLADTTGLSLVHLNRSLRSLRCRGLIRLSGRRVHILDLAGLQNLAEFKPSYLNFNKEPEDELAVSTRKGWNGQH